MTFDIGKVQCLFCHDWEFIILRDTFTIEVAITSHYHIIIKGLKK